MSNKEGYTLPELRSLVVSEGQKLSADQKNSLRRELQRTITSCGIVSIGNDGRYKTYPNPDKILTRFGEKIAETYTNGNPRPLARKFQKMGITLEKITKTRELINF